MIEFKEIPKLETTGLLEILTKKYSAIKDELAENESIRSFKEMFDLNMVETFFELDELIQDTGIKLYHSQDYQKAFLELHDKHTFWKLEESVNEDIICFVIEDAIAHFKKETGVELFLLGRSNRHVCVEYTIDNALKYSALTNFALALEKEVVSMLNSKEVECETTIYEERIKAYIENKYPDGETRSIRLYSDELIDFIVKMNLECDFKPALIIRGE